ncbi:MAG: hypothetical protein KDD42_10400, partial [Bdellovibrionales bacterium]|nr:hypothetical protein [Bdellovibrionales bacterium]
SIGWKHDKTEGLALRRDRRTFLISNDNDFGLRSDTDLDLKEMFLDAIGLHLTQFGKKPVVEFEQRSVATEIWSIRLPTDL